MISVEHSTASDVVVEQDAVDVELAECTPPVDGPSLT